MASHLVVVGAGHAHLTLLKHLDRLTGAGVRVTVVSAGDWHYYSGMGPGLLSGRYRPCDIGFNVRRMTEDRGGTFLAAPAVRLDPGGRAVFLEDGRRLDYDVLSLNTGSQVPFTAGASEGVAVYPVKPIDNLLTLKADLERRLPAGVPRMVVAGGGPAGVEIAANLEALVRRRHGRAHVHLVAGGRLLERFPPAVGRLVRRRLRHREITVREETRVVEAVSGGVRLDDGTHLPADLLVAAVGTRPAPLMAESGLAVGPDGGLLVDEQLQSVSHPGVFGGGDCISFQARALDRVGVHAVRQNPVLFHNLRAALLGAGPLMRFRPQRNYLLIMNMGDGTGIVNRGPWTFDGRIGFWLKHFIDSRFMEKFQVSGERRRGGQVTVDS
jgi:NADH dehydrogenase FAD-containing subunit